MEKFRERVITDTRIKPLRQKGREWERRWRRGSVERLGKRRKWMEETRSLALIKWHKREIVDGEYTTTEDKKKNASMQNHTKKYDQKIQKLKVRNKAKARR